MIIVSGRRTYRRGAAKLIDISNNNLYCTMEELPTVTIKYINILKIQINICRPKFNDYHFVVSSQGRVVWGQTDKQKHMEEIYHNLRTEPA